MTRTSTGIGADYVHEDIIHKAMFHPDMFHPDMLHPDMIRPDMIHSENIYDLDAAVAEVFELMLGRHYIPESARPSPHDGFAATVQFSGSLCGACVVQMDLQAAILLTQDLIGESAGGLDADPGLSADTVGEICNMIAGSWKSRLAPDLATCTLSSPTVTFNAAAAGSAAAGTEAYQTSPVLLRSLTRAYRFQDHRFNLELTIV